MVRSGRDFSRTSTEFSPAGAAAKVAAKGKSGTLPLTLAGVRVPLLEPYASRIPHFPFSDSDSMGATFVDLTLARVDTTSVSMLG